MGYLFFSLCAIFLFFFFYKKERARAKKEKELFAYQVAHEFRSPLTILLGYAEALEGLELSSAQRKEIAHKIVSSSQKLERIIQDLLFLVKGERGKTFCDLSKCLEHCLEELQTLHPNATFTIEKKKEPLFLLVAEGLLEIALRNLLENAVLHSQKDPTISISIIEKEKYVELFIEDRAKKIPKKERKKIFESFYTTNQKQGHGLGLFIVQKVMERSQGKISLSSSDLGNRFSLLLPKAVSFQISDSP